MSSPTLTPAQLPILKADVLADHSFDSVPHNSDGTAIISAAYALAAVPAFVVWCTTVYRNDLQSLPGFDWTLVDNQTVGKGRIWEWLFMSNAAIDASQANVRAGIAACWVGSAPMLAVQAAMLAGCQRSANRAEKLFATGTGTAQSPGIMTFEGALGYSDIIAAMGW